MEKSKHGMTSEQATDKKISGHLIENEFIFRNGGVVLKGTGKVDVTNQEDNYSIKRGKKVQWALLSQNSVENEFILNNIKTEEINKYFNFLPDKIEYVQNKSKYKKNIYADDLSKVVSSNVDKILNIFITKNGQVNKLAFYDDRTELNGFGTGSFFIFDAKESIKTLSEMIKEIYFTPGGKVVIKGDLQLFEIELRKGTNHKKLLVHSHTRRILDILKSKIEFVIK
jgi:hypothetical protein